MAGVKNLVVLFSGEGTNLEAIIRHLHGKEIGGATIHVVPVTNRPGAGGIARAAKYGLETEVIDHTLYPDREAFDEALVAAITRHDPALVAMAGFMRILTPVFTSRIEAVNLHPSLLPLFKGARAIERSFTSGMKVGGVTIHRVTAELDSGEILAQACVPIEPDDTLESFEARLHALEHRLYPETLERLLAEA
ncbi:phosphoribosylglycinamide formyltransferase [Hydrogenimonas sp.]